MRVDVFQNVPKYFSYLAVVGLNAVYPDKSHNEVYCANTNNILMVFMVFANKQSTAFKGMKNVLIQCYD